MATRSIGGPQVDVSSVATQMLTLKSQNLTTGYRVSGQYTLVGGTATVTTTAVQTGDIILLQPTALNASPAIGSHYVTALTAGASFAVQSYDAAGAPAATDVSGGVWILVRTAQTV